MKLVVFIVAAGLASASAQTDPCHTAHTDQASCDADQKTGGGCTVSECLCCPFLIQHSTVVQMCRGMLNLRLHF
jgi:hypothetical protein